ncbi:AsnC family protein [Streptomyces sp. NPDC056638]|uniref:AsnC family protein n=1 Tax=Streptomyces sp. NPDC056638 TaxID=3345887 RepID=UPI00368F4DDB
MDLALVNALQLRPRASWTELAPPLGVTAGTLARRWERLTGEGLAWASAVPGREFVRPRCTASCCCAAAPAAVPGSPNGSVRSRRPRPSSSPGPAARTCHALLRPFQRTLRSGLWTGRHTGSAGPPWSRSTSGAAHRVRQTG